MYPGHECNQQNLNDPAKSLGTTQKAKSFYPPRQKPPYRNLPGGRDDEVMSGGLKSRSADGAKFLPEYVIETAVGCLAKCRAGLGVGYDLNNPTLITGRQHSIGHKVQVQPSLTEGIF